MTPPVHPGPFLPDRLKAFDAARAAVRQAGYSETSLRSILDGRSDRRLDVPLVLHRIREPSPLHTLVRLFILRQPVGEPTLKEALSGFDPEEWIACGILRREPDGIRATAVLRPWRDLFLLHDFLPPPGEALPTDYVMSGASASSTSLTALTIRRPVATALDLGTGAGIHALLAASHAGHVVATDPNPRALNFAAMNARLNGIGNISFRQGSFFEPVHAERFDLIVCNPPFIVAPPSDLMYRSAGTHGDSVSERVLREASPHLQPGGCMVSLMTWQHAGGDRWSERPRSWAADSDCDLWLLQMADSDPADYAARMLHETESVDAPDYGRKLGQWLAYYRELGIQRITIGAAILRRRPSQQHWVRCDSISPAVLGLAGDQLDRIATTEDLLSEPDADARLLGLRLVPDPDTVIHQRLVPQDTGFQLQSATLQSTRGIDFQARLDPMVLAFLGRCDGRTLREGIEAVASQFGIDYEAAADGGVRIARQLLKTGMLRIA